MEGCLRLVNFRERGLYGCLSARPNEELTMQSLRINVALCPGHP